MINAAGRQYLFDSGQKICIIKQFRTRSKFIVVSEAFSPFGSGNEIIFYPSWQMYAMSGNPHKIEKAKIQLSLDADPGEQLIFNGNSLTRERADSKGAFGLNNQSAATTGISGGLTQKIQVNNSTSFYPININPLPVNQVSYFMLSDSVLVFIANGMDSGSVLLASTMLPHEDAEDFPSVMGKALRVKLKKDTTIYFDNSLNCFSAKPLQTDDF